MKWSSFEQCKLWSNVQPFFLIKVTWGDGYEQSNQIYNQKKKRKNRKNEKIKLTSRDSKSRYIEVIKA